MKRAVCDQYPVDDLYAHYFFQNKDNGTLEKIIFDVITLLPVPTAMAKFSIMY